MKCTKTTMLTTAYSQCRTLFNHTDYECMVKKDNEDIECEKDDSDSSSSDEDLEGANFYPC